MSKRKISHDYWIDYLFTKFEEERGKKVKTRDEDDPSFNSWLSKVPVETLEEWLNNLEKNG